MIATPTGFLNYTLRQPFGVVGAIIPWNFPLPFCGAKCGPILAAGNTVVLKPAEQTPLTALLFAEACRDAGLPDGVVNVVTGMGPDRRASDRPAPRRGHDQLHRVDRCRSARSARRPAVS